MMNFEMQTKKLTKNVGKKRPVVAELLQAVLPAISRIRRLIFQKDTGKHACFLHIVLKAKKISLKILARRTARIQQKAYIHWTTKQHRVHRVLKKIFAQKNFGIYFEFRNADKMK